MRDAGGLSLSRRCCRTVALAEVDRALREAGAGDGARLTTRSSRTSTSTVGGFGRSSRSSRSEAHRPRIPDYGEPARPLERRLRCVPERRRGGRGEGHGARARPAGPRGPDPVRPGGGVSGFEAGSSPRTARCGRGRATRRHHVPPSTGLPPEDRAPENLCSVASSSGAFSLTRAATLRTPEPGAPSFWDAETPIAKAIGNGRDGREPPRLDRRRESVLPRDARPA